MDNGDSRRLRLPSLTRGHGIRCALVVATLLAVRRGSGQIPGNNISDQLAVIAAACRENAARIQTLQFSGTVTLTGRQFERQWDPIAGQTYSSQTREFSVWKDTVKLRFDETSNRVVDGQTHEVVYNVPYGEHFCRPTEADRQTLKREFGTTQTTQRNLITADEGYLYQPESNELFFGRPNRGRVEEQPEVQVAMNRTYRGHRIDEALDRWAELAGRGGRAMELSHLEGGRYLIRATVSVLREDNQRHQSSSEAVVDLDQGGNVVSCVKQVDGQIVWKGEFQYMNADGAWVVTRAEIAEMVGPDGVPEANAVYEIRPENVQINAPIDPRVFTFEGLEVRRGAHVVNQDTGENYVYDDVPLHVKAALAAAQMMDEELAETAARVSQSPAPPQPEPEPHSALAAAPVPGVPGRTPSGPSGPAAITVVTPQGRAAPPAEPNSDLAPAASLPVEQSTPPSVPAARPPSPEASMDTRVVTPHPAPEPQTAPPDIPAPSSPTAQRMVPNPAMTVVVVSAGCAAALGIGLWKLMGRRTPRAG